MLTLTKYAIRIMLQIVALFGLTFIYSVEKVNDTAFDGEGTGTDVLVIIVAGVLLGIIILKFIL